MNVRSRHYFFTRATMLKIESAYKKYTSRRPSENMSAKIDQDVTKYVWIVPVTNSRYYRAFNSNNSDGQAFNKETAILYARYSGSEDKVDAAIARHYEHFSRGVYGDVSDATVLKFLAAFIQQEQDLGIDWHDGAELLVWLASKRALDDRDFKAITKYCCTLPDLE